MDPVDRATLLRLEKVRIYWDFGTKELEMHRQRYMQGFAILASAGLATVGSVALERVPPVAGAALAIGLFGGSAYAYLLLRSLPGRLQRLSLRAVRGVDKLIAAQEDL